MIEIIRKIALFLCFLSIGGVALSGENPFLFDKNEYDLGAVEGGRSLTFDIPLKNKTGYSLKILSVEPSCGCTEALIMNESIGAGKEGIIRVTIDTTGKIGKIVKTIEIMTNISSKPFILTLRGLIKHSGKGVVDAGAIFRGDCRRCHVGRSIQSKQGEILFNAVCFMCHKDYSSLELLSEETLRKSISDGLPGTSMPGFAEVNGGPLNIEQVGSLVEFLNPSALRIQN